MEKKIAFITGASSGIGKACAKYLAEEGFAIIACGRREDRLVELKTNFQKILTTIIWFLM